MWSTATTKKAEYDGSWTGRCPRPWRSGIENWPDNFFGDEMGEIAAITEAALRRRMEQSG